MSEASNSVTSGFSKLIISARWLILLVFAIAIAVLGFFSTQFKIDASADTLLTKNNELYIKTQVANQKFSPSEFILVAYQPTSGDVFTQATFDDIAMLSDKFSQMPRVKSINSMLSVPLIQTRSQLLSGAEVNKLNYQNQQYSLEDMRSMLKDHPIYTDLLVSKDMKSTAIQIVFESNEELDEINANITDIQRQLLDGELSDEQEKRVEQLKAQASVIDETLNKERQQEVKEIEEIIQATADKAKVYIGGSYVVGIRLVEIVTQDLVYFGIAITVLISVMLLALFRSIKWLLFPLGACGASVGLTTGILAILQIPATVISANFIALQLILTLAIMLHLITCYRQVSRDNPDFSQAERLKATLAEKLSPCFFAAITTSVGFGSLIASGLQPVMDFGIMMLISNVVTLSVALLLFPALLSFLPASKESTEYGFVTAFLGAIKQLVERFTKTVILIPIIGIAVLSLGIASLNVENSFIDYFHTDTKIHQELKFIDQEFGGSTPLDIIVDTNKALPSEDTDTELFLRADEVNLLHLGHATVDAFDATGNVTSLINFTTLAKELNDNKPLTEYELDAIYTLVDQQVIDQLIGAYVDTDTSTMRISTRIQDTLPGLNRAEFLDNLKSDLQAAGLEQDSYQLTSLFILYQDILSRLIDSQVSTLGIVYVALAIILFVIFKSIKLALISLVPNVLTTAAILGVIGWFGIPLDLMTITIASIAMGIAIDDTIHFVDAYISAEPGKEMQSAFSHTGLAITYTSTLIALGFGMFIFSDFMPSIYFGVLTACAMLFAFLTDVTVLPALLKQFYKTEPST